MKIYKSRVDQRRILDPDHCNGQYFESNHLYDFFKTLDIPSNVDLLTGIYLSVESTNKKLEQRELLTNTMTLLKKHFDIGQSHLIYIHPNQYFIVLFNIDRVILQDIYINFMKDLDEKKYIIHCGIYFCKKEQNAYTFYHKTKEQHTLSLERNSYATIYPSLDALLEPIVDSSNDMDIDI